MSSVHDGTGTHVIALTVWRRFNQILCMVSFFFDSICYGFGLTEDCESSIAAAAIVVVVVVVVVILAS